MNTFFKKYAHVFIFLQSSSDDNMEVGEAAEVPSSKRPRMSFKTLNDHLRTPKFTPQGKRNMNHLMVKKS